MCFIKHKPKNFIPKYKLKDRLIRLTFILILLAGLFSKLRGQNLSEFLVNVEVRELSCEGNPISFLNGSISLGKQNSGFVLLNSPQTIFSANYSSLPTFLSISFDQFPSACGNINTINEVLSLDDEQGCNSIVYSYDSTYFIEIVLNWEPTVLVVDVVGRALLYDSEQKLDIIGKGLDI